MATVQTRIGPLDHGRATTLDEFREADEEPGYRYELARGVLKATQVPDDLHWQVVNNVQALFHAYRAAHPGTILRIGGGGGCRVWIPEMSSRRNPDAAVVFHGTAKDESGRQAPRLVVEVVSRGGEIRDYETKREEYALFGIEEYGIVDPRLRRVTLLNREPSGNWAELTFRDGEMITSPLLPGLSATVSEIWVDLEPS